MSGLEVSCLIENLVDSLAVPRNCFVNTEQTPKVLEGIEHTLALIWYNGELNNALYCQKRDKVSQV